MEEAVKQVFCDLFEVDDGWELCVKIELYNGREIYLKQLLKKCSFVLDFSQVGKAEDGKAGG